MYRRILQTLFLSTLKRTSRINRAAPCSCLHIMNTRFASDRPWLPSPEPETTKQLSEMNPDEFGAMSPMSVHDEAEEMELSEEEGTREEFVAVDDTGRKQRKPMYVYHKIIKKLLEQKRVADAIDVLETRMLKLDRIKPDYYCYNLLINGCAKVGYCEKAFKLYNQMKKRMVKASPATFTGLINACAMSSFPDDASIRLTNLRKNLLEDRRELNMINYNVMIKAYARLKDLKSAFAVADEALSKGFTMQNETFGSLLQACISDQHCGLRHALLVWHKMRAKRLTPDLWNYNLLIRCIRDCGVGDEDELRDLVARLTKGDRCDSLQIVYENENPFEKETVEAGQQLISEVNKLEEVSSTPEFTFTELEAVENRPNLLARKPYLGNIISIAAVKTPTDRLLLLGGYKSLLQEMENDKVKPDIKTFTQLLNIMPSTSDAEKYLMKEMKKYKVDLDIDFCNMLIKQRAVRMDFEKAKEVLSVIQENYLQPDIVTFGVLAMSCRKQWEAEELIEDMKSFGYRMNVEILGAMLSQACCQFKFDYVMYIMRLTKNFGIEPSEQYMQRLAELDQKAIEFRKRKRKKDQKLPPVAQNAWFHEASLRFHDYYVQWKKKVVVFKPPHPYRQFKQGVRQMQNAHYEGRKEYFQRIAAKYGNPDESKLESGSVTNPGNETRRTSENSEKPNKWNNHKLQRNSRKNSHSQLQNGQFSRTRSYREPHKYNKQKIDSTLEKEQYSEEREVNDKSSHSLPNASNAIEPNGSRKLKFKRSYKAAESTSEDSSPQIATI